MPTPFSNIRLAQSYLAFRLKAKSSVGHGIHSPLVYSFAREVLHGRTNSTELEPVEEYRNRALKSGAYFPHSNFGAGSKISRQSLPIGKLIKTSSVSPKKGAFLYRLAKWMNAQSILELGTSVGISTSYLSTAQPNAKIVTLEGDELRANFSRELFQQMGFGNIEVLQGSFDSTLYEALEMLPPLDIVFFDGYHNPEPTLRYFRQCINQTQSVSAFVFDDIRWSRNMYSAWKVMSNHSKVAVSIDLFHMGVIIFRKDIPKQHFMINF